MNLTHFHPKRTENL